jgi:DegV family protein with EDD domain
MTGRVAIVTDSTASLPADLAARLGIAVVQLELQVGDYVNTEGRIGHPELIDAMRKFVPVATAPPPSAAFFWTYQEAAMNGADAVVSVHLSKRLSLTVEAAREAAGQVQIPVHVVDSQMAAMCLGYPVIAAAQAAASGLSVAQILNVLEERCKSATEFFYVDTLEYLRRSGRIGAAAALVGTALKIKPLLSLEDGQIVPLDRARGANRALKRVADMAVKAAGRRDVDIAVEYFGSRDEADALAKRLRAKIPGSKRFLMTQTSAIIGAHVGPGALGVTISPY